MGEVPLAKRTSTSDTDSPIREDAMTKRSKRKPVVLVVDDDFSVAQTLAWLFQQAAYACAMAHTGRDAIDLASQMTIDVALVDAVLPDIDGLETAAAICRKIAGCKILLMSGDPEGVRMLEVANQQGMHFDLLAKPIPLPELLEKVSSLLSQESETRAKGLALAAKRKAS